MRLIIKNNYKDCAKWTADYIAGKIKSADPTKEKPFVLGLPTGSTPLGVYERLIELYNKKLISFENVITFNMDEYYGLDENDPQSKKIPAINEELCIGCGTCEALCPSRPLSAIYVEGHEVHRVI